MTIKSLHASGGQCGGNGPVRSGLLIFNFAFLILNSRGAIIDAASASRADVGAAYALCATGDTLRIPAGTATWPTYLIITNAITLQGAGVGNTKIGIGRPDSSTTLQFDLLTPNQPTRMTGIEFFDGGSPGGFSYVIAVFGGGFGNNGYNQHGDTRSMRIDHCKFDHLPSVPINCNDTIGVIDHNEFLLAGMAGIYPFHRQWNQLSYSSGSWSDTNGFGTDKFLFIEDNIFTQDPPGYAVHDCYGGARVVFRHNTVNRGWFEVHGTESGGRPRGGRAFEVYSNFWTGDVGVATMCNFRSGVSLVYGNTVSNSSLQGITLVNYRASYQSWYGDALSGGATGINPWDINDTTDYTGNGLGGGPNGLKASLVASGSDSDPEHSFLPRLTVAGANWTVNQFRGYAIIKTNIPANPELQFASEIFWNTTNTITYFHALHPPTMTFTNGEAFVMHHCLQAIDSVGRSSGAILSSSGDEPEIPETWNDQITDPCYAWNNVKVEGGSILFSSPTSLIRENEHYFNDTDMPGYTSYTYPHPLTASGTITNLRLGGSFHMNGKVRLGE